MRALGRMPMWAGPMCHSLRLPCAATAGSLKHVFAALSAASAFQHTANPRLPRSGGWGRRAGGNPTLGLASGWGKSPRPPASPRSLLAHSPSVFGRPQSGPPLGHVRIRNMACELQSPFQCPSATALPLQARIGPHSPASELCALAPSHPPISSLVNNAGGIQHEGIRPCQQQGPHPPGHRCSLLRPPGRRA